MTAPTTLTPEKIQDAWETNGNNLDETKEDERILKQIIQRPKPTMIAQKIGRLARRFHPSHSDVPLTDAEIREGWDTGGDSLPDTPQGRQCAKIIKQTMERHTASAFKVRVLAQKPEFTNELRNRLLKVPGKQHDQR